MNLSIAQALTQLTFRESANYKQSVSESYSPTHQSAKVAGRINPGMVFIRECAHVSHIPCMSAQRERRVSLRDTIDSTPDLVSHECLKILKTKKKCKAFFCSHINCTFKRLILSSLTFFMLEKLVTQWATYLIWSFKCNSSYMDFIHIYVNENCFAENIYETRALSFLRL